LLDTKAATPGQDSRQRAKSNYRKTKVSKKDLFTVVKNKVFRVRANEFIEVNTCMSSAQARREAMLRAGRNSGVVVGPEILDGKDKVVKFTNNLVEVEVKSYPPGRPPGVPDSGTDKDD
jgi:hypothetical protein